MKLINKELCQVVSSHLHTMEDTISYWTLKCPSSVSLLGLLYPSSSKNCIGYETTSCFFDATLRYRH